MVLRFFFFFQRTTIDGSLLLSYFKKQKLMILWKFKEPQNIGLHANDEMSFQLTKASSRHGGAFKYEEKKCSSVLHVG